MTAINTIAIVGATGLVGAAATEHFSSLPGWDVVTLSRRLPRRGKPVHHISADLTDAVACRTAFSEAPAITHVLYAALYEHEDLLEGWKSTAQAGINLSMLQNVVDNVAGSGFRHLTILQGGKAYGSHLGRVPVPAKERWPRMDHHIFYWQQEDYLKSRSAGASWNYSVLRPQLILGDALGSPINIIAALGVYASVMRELGRPLFFPGGGQYVTACADSRLIARAAEFCFVESKAAGETYNVVNGDAVNWRDIWTPVAAHFNMPVGSDQPLKLSEEMPLLAHCWDAIVTKYQLQPLTMSDIVGASWQSADLTWGYGKERPFDRLMSPIKLRQAGFADCYDTEDAILYWLDRLQQANILPR
ncbi:NAD-dependent epimerase/dehydratase family protein [Rhizobium sp. BK060]|uniref:NAD-dependent epimerase/dehydratase family protein n=1 Tax=Rhizobium sp. BK060 TaxID=2587096 RepID=UPI00161D7310|nr:NAD-dependent epimerase/dehydratase family protein [Rhizobium sp. BK060]MBB3396179.1 nucleoside-diphosphate-sugar epimerase [Rhizobium sp. BK060]